MRRGRLAHYRLIILEDISANAQFAPEAFEALKRTSQDSSAAVNQTVRTG
jgi:hypothetical protein